MKIRKLFTMVAILASLSLTACGGNTNNGEDNNEPEVSECKTHKWGKEKLNEVPATCTTEGSYQQKCTVCGAIQQKKTSALGHDWDAGTVTQQPTCTAKGKKTVSCTRCSATEEQDVAAKGHSFGSWVDDTPATCATPGTQKRTCSECGAIETQDVPTLEHDWKSAGSKITQEGYPDMDPYKCELIPDSTHYALRYSALDYDETLSTTDKMDIQTDYIRFNEAQYLNQTETLGCHIFYKIYIPAAAATTTASLAFKIQTNSNRKSIFNTDYSNDNTKGYEKVDGQYVESAKRYGLKVNGDQITIGNDAYGDVAGSTTGWFDWPVQFELKAGENIIELYQLGGYRARMYEFQVTNLPALE